MDEIASSLVGKRVYDCFSGENFLVIISPIFPILILLLRFIAWSGKLFGLLYVRFDKELFKNIITLGITNTKICEKNGKIWL